MTNRWLLVTDDETWQSLIQSGFWGLSKRYKKTTRKIRKGDQAVAYVKFFSAIYGIIRITSEPYEAKDDPDYPIKFNIEPETFLSEPTSIRPLIRDLSFIRNKKRWYGFFQTSLKAIPEKDFELIRGYLLGKI